MESTLRTATGSRLLAAAIGLLAPVTAGPASACHIEANAGGPYQAGCADAAAGVVLDGSGSQSCGHPITYEWSTDCPAGVFDDPTFPYPLLTLTPPAAACSFGCQVTLTIRNAAQNLEDSDTTTLTVDDQGAPLVDALFEPAPAAPSTPPSSASPGAPITYRVGCAATDDCDPAPALVARLEVTFEERQARHACVTRTVTIPVGCGDLVDVALVPPACPRRPGAPVSVRSAGRLRIAALAAELVVTATDACGFVGEGRAAATP